MSEQKIDQKLIAAYDKMMERVHHFIDDTEQHTLPTLQKSIDNAKKQAVELKEVTAEEAEKLAGFIRRDIHDVAHHISESGQEFSSWFSFDLQLIEDRILDTLSKVADKTRSELAQLASQAKFSQEYRTGEVTGIGTLECSDCHTLLHFKKTNRIPPCPKCHKTVFTRVKKR